MAQAFFNQLVKAEWLVQAKKPDRDMKLLESVIFSDPDGKKWTAKEGAIINGASIPGFLWSVFPGPPYVGDYRRASVLHDYYCENPQGEDFPDIHYMFYQAMKCDGVPEVTARMMYWAVLPWRPKKGKEVFTLFSESITKGEDDFLPIQEMRRISVEIHKEQ